MTSAAHAEPAPYARSWSATPDALIGGQPTAGRRHITGQSIGLALSDGFGDAQLRSKFSPAVSWTGEVGSARARWTYGFTSAPLLATLRDNPSVHLAMLDAGALFGSDDLALGPYATGGLFAVGAGLRAVWTPWRRRYDHIGLDLRLIAGPREASAWAMLTFRRVQAAPSDGERMREREGICARLSGSFGVAVAGANRQDTWRGIGYSPVGYSGSPYLAIACEGGKHAGLFVGGETAPFVTSRFPGAFNKASPWFGTATVGAWLGGEAVRIGPFASVGSLIAGAGGRLVFSPWTTASGARAGVEARAIVFAPSSPAVAGTFAIYLAPDPRRPRAGAIE